jgi:acyl carrier protein
MKIKSREMVWDRVVECLTELLAERGEVPGEVSRSTLLSADLDISSVEAIHLMILLEDSLGRSLDFQALAIRDGEYVQDLSVGELADFVSDTLKLS